MPSLRWWCHAKTIGGTLGIDRHANVPHEHPPQRAQHRHLDGDNDEQMADESAVVGAHGSGRSRVRLVPSAKLSAGGIESHMGASLVRVEVTDKRFLRGLVRYRLCIAIPFRRASCGGHALLHGNRHGPPCRPASRRVVAAQPGRHELPVGAPGSQTPRTAGARSRAHRPSRSGRRWRPGRSVPARRHVLAAAGRPTA